MIGWGKKEDKKRKLSRISIRHLLSHIVLNLFSLHSLKFNGDNALTVAIFILLFSFVLSFPIPFYPIIQRAHRMSQQLMKLKYQY